MLLAAALGDLGMSKLQNNKQELANRFPTLPHISPLPTWFIMKHLALQEELKLTKQRLLELESRISGEKVIVIREITREEAKKEIRQLFLTGRTLYYSDIAEELKLDLKLVVDICREFQENKEIGIDEDALARI
ncbi:MAG TPA: hypothetical protein VFF92_01635 [Dehalococcoidales bacterium]|nr:hypothetical protein [Dehalococcoidales bacterium]